MATSSKNALTPEKVAITRAMRSNTGAQNIQQRVTNPMVKAGYLFKKGANRHNWNKRWFELRPHSLAYYQDRKVIIYLISINF